MKQITLIVGSLRKNSFNRQLADEIVKFIGSEAKTSFLQYEEIPIFHQDRENPVLTPVAEARKAIRESDGLWIVTPEYNGNLSPLLLNLLDWMSRPADPTDRETPSVLAEKLVTISGAAGKSGASSSREKCAELCQRTKMKVVGGNGTGIALEGDNFKTDRLTLTEEEREALTAQVKTFLNALNED